MNSRRSPEAHDDAEAVEEVSRLFAAYETALMADDFVALRGFFCADAVRYATDGNQYGVDAIEASRRRRAGPIERTLQKTSFTCVGDGVLAITEFTRVENGARGRQTQLWIRDHDSWRVIHAHVSMLAD